MTLAAGLLISGMALAAAPQASRSASGEQSNLEKQVTVVREKVADQKQKTQQLQKKVDALQKQNRADRQRIRENDRTIARLQARLEKLNAGNPAPAGSR